MTEYPTVELKEVLLQKLDEHFDAHMVVGEPNSTSLRKWMDDAVHVIGALRIASDKHEALKKLALKLNGY